MSDKDDSKKDKGNEMTLHFITSNTKTTELEVNIIYSKKKKKTLHFPVF